MTDGLPQLVCQIATAGDAVAVAVQRVLSGPFPQDHFGVMDEVRVDGNCLTVDVDRLR
jgi:hypothetical protein